MATQSERKRQEQAAEAGVPYEPVAEQKAAEQVADAKQAPKSDKTTRSKLEKAGWTIQHEQEPEAFTAAGQTGETVTVTARPGHLIALKNVGGTIVELAADTLELLWDRISYWENHNARSEDGVTEGPGPH